MTNDPTFTALRTARALERGATAAELRGPAWIRVDHGLVKPARSAEDVVFDRVAVATGLMTDTCVLGGWAALRTQGNTWFDGVVNGHTQPPLVHCLPGTQLRRRPGIVPFRGHVHPDEIIELENYAVTTMARAVFDEMRMARNVREAVVALDMATSATILLPHTTRTRVQRVLESHHKVRGLVQARKAFALGSTRSASPWETRTRLVAELDVGLASLAVNVPVFDLHDNLLGVADLLDEESGLVIESDGADHREVVRHTDDNRREEKFERAGLVVCRITGLDHRERWQTVGRIAAAHRDALASSRRLWTVTKPGWWSTWPHARRWD